MVKLGLVLALVALLAAPAVIAQATPPMNVYGTLYIDGAAAGSTVITVVDNTPSAAGATVTTTTTNSAGAYSVNIDVAQNHTLGFRANSRSATEQVVETRGASQLQDLHIGTNAQAGAVYGSGSSGAASAAPNATPGPGLVLVALGVVVAALVFGRARRN